MKVVSLLVLFLVSVLCVQAHAQYGRPRDSWLQPKLRSVHLEGLLLGIPSLGVGVDMDLSRGYEYADSSSSYGVGVRSSLGAGYVESSFGAKYAPDWYADADVLLRGSLVVEGFSAAILSGYGYRIWHGESAYPSGHRLKFGAELNYVVYQGRIALRFRVMGAALGTNGNVEVGPLALGVAFGWFRRK
ncbi:MAG: hypothetical protein M5R41_14425 [Bacteroidia bacterium]|nr:hypothetical protein [Bacteroidia bacterium]